MRFQTMTVAHRLLMAVSCFVLASIVATFYVQWQKVAINEFYGALVRERSPGYVAQARSQRHFQIVAKHVNRMILEAQRPQKVDELWGLVEQEFGNFATRIGQFERSNPDQQAMADVARSEHKVIEQHARAAHAAVKAGNPALALEIVRSQLDPAVDTLRDTLKLQVDDNVKRLSEASLQADSRLKQAQVWGVGIMAVGLFVSGWIAWRVSRSIIDQLGAEPAALLATAQEVSQGDLSARAVSALDGSVMVALQSMRTNLREVVARVRQSSEAVASASHEIAEGNQELSVRTESQASALQQAASNMEQLSSTVRQNADNARQASLLAQDASSVAIKGGEVVALMVETMQGIDESSKRIADIIGVIDGIAFQINILSLNAAVEAARAGEQGRGFAVVATEVRSLAGRSAEAAREIKALILASVERVEQGSELVDRVGAAMSKVVGSISRVSETVGAISAASMEQSQGVAQVGKAVAQIDQATQQNSALVEEMAAAAASLKSLAGHLVDTVAKFRLQSDELALLGR